MSIPQTNEILDILRDLSSPERAEKMRGYSPTRMEILGVTNPDIRLVIKELYPLLKGNPPGIWIGLAEKLVKEEVLEAQMLAYMLLDKGKTVPAIDYGQLSKLEGILDNWVSVDTYGTLVYGVLWQLNRISDKDVLALQDSLDVWYRRLALVATVALNLSSRGGTGDTTRTLMICSGAVNDTHDMIIKALSWALRSLIRWDAKAVERFVEEHREILSNRILREVSHKLDFGTKN